MSRRPLGVGLGALVAAVVLLAAAIAGGAVGELTYQGCITGENQSGPSGSGACAAIPGVSPGGSESGLQNLNSVVVSADGKSVYAASGGFFGGGDDAVARFRRNPTSGALTYQGCITGETESGPSGSGACATIPSATSGGKDSGLDTLMSLALSADGKSLYTVSFYDAAVARFKRNTTSGRLTYKGCTTGEKKSGPSGSGACTKIPSAMGEDGKGSGLSCLNSLVLSADGTSLYTASRCDAAVARFDRDPTSGALTYQGCITGSASIGASGACTAIPSAIDNVNPGQTSGLYGLTSLAVSADGESLYTASREDSAVGRFDRDPTSGALDYLDCLTGDTQIGPAGSGACELSPSATSIGTGSGIGYLTSLALSADGSTLYTASDSDAAVARFKRSAASGALTYKDCTSGSDNLAGTCALSPGATSDGSNSGLDSPSSVELSADGKSLYTGSPFDAAVGRFKRATVSGALTYKGCITGEIESGPAGSGACDAIASAAVNGDHSGLGGLSSLALSADDNSLYAVSSFDAAIARFDRETPPP